MEQLDEDTLYFLLKSGLQDRIQFDHQANANKQTDHSEERWDGVLRLCAVEFLNYHTDTFRKSLLIQLSFRVQTMLNFNK